MCVYISSSDQQCGVMPIKGKVDQASLLKLSEVNLVGRREWF